MFKLLFGFMGLTYEGRITAKDFASDELEEIILDEISEVLGANCPQDISFEDFEMKSLSVDFDGFVDGTFSVRVVYVEYADKEDEEGTIYEEIVDGNIVEI